MTTSEKNKRGRPAKPADRRRSIVRKIAFTPGEDARIRENVQALGLTEPHLIRHGALSYRRHTDLIMAMAERVEGKTA